MSQTLSQKRALWQKDYVKPHSRVPRVVDTWSEFGLRVLALILIGITVGLLIIAGELMIDHIKNWIDWVMA